MVFTEQHHVEITGRLAVDLKRCGAEHLARIGAARVVAENRQGIAPQQALDRRQVDPFTTDPAFGRGAADNLALGVQQVHLDARVDLHQLAEQVTHGIGHQALCVHQHRVTGDVLRQVPGQALHHFLLMHLVGAHLHPRRRAAAHQQQHGEHQGQALRQGQPHGRGSSPVANL
ncbi:hypothetical protein D9M69_506170 [compost metagenome]